MNYTGKILVSSDHSFLKMQYLIYVFEHNENGAVGVVLNGDAIGKLSRKHIKDIINSPEGKFETFKTKFIEEKIEYPEIFFGGPYKTEGFYFIHAYKDFCHATRIDIDHVESLFSKKFNEKPVDNKISEGVYFGTPFTYGHLIEANILDQSKFRFYSGQQCWAAGQIEMEITSKMWSVLELDEELFFNYQKCESLARSVKTKPDFFDFIKFSNN